MNWNFISLAIKVLITLQLKGLQATVPDPCPNDIESTQVAEMCTESSAVEGENETSDKVNSVIIRMRNQRDCTCHVFFQQQIKVRQIRVLKYNNSLSSSPENSPCGLAIDLSILNKTNEFIKSIECTEGSDIRYFSLKKNEALQFTSRPTAGEFKSGYCIQVIRDAISGNFRLSLKCSKSATNEVLTTVKAYDYSKKDNTNKGTSTTTYEYSTGRYDVSTSESTFNDSTTFLSYNEILNTEKSEMLGKTSTDTEVYIYIIAGVGAGVVVAVLVIVIILGYRRKLPCKGEEKPQGCQQNLANQIITDDPEYDGLRENILYESSDKPDFNKSTMNIMDNDINYSTIDIKETVNPNHMKTEIQNLSFVNKAFGMSENRLRHISPQNGNGDVYAVVEKRKTTPQSDCNKEDTSCHEHVHVYSVVDKTGINKQKDQYPNEQKEEMS